MKRMRTKSSLRPLLPRHPPRPPRHLTLGNPIWAAALAVLLLLAGAAAAGQQNRAEQFRSSFLLFGTVFAEPGALLPGAEIEVRRADEQKYRWRARADRRGEFGIRVPLGAEYELKVTARGFQEQVRKVDARQGSREDLVFRLRPAPQKARQGAKK